MYEKHSLATSNHPDGSTLSAELDPYSKDVHASAEDMQSLKSHLQANLGSTAVRSPDSYVYSSDVPYDSYGISDDEYDWEPPEVVETDVEYSIPDVQAVDMMERRGYARQAPRFLEQLYDTGRTNLVKYVHGQRKALGTLTTGQETVSLPEHDSINALDEFLETVIDELGEDSHEGKVAASMQDRLTFIGRKEYLEATAAIALSWKLKLDDDPDAQIWAVTGRIEDKAIKSDAYMLDTILGHFTDEELERYQGRLVTDPAELRIQDGDTEVIMLDDWTISGEQLSSAALAFCDDNPGFADSLTIQLIAATRDRIENGLEATSELDSTLRASGSAKRHVPVQAYFRAHKAYPGMAETSGAHITGAHCAVDYDFNEKIQVMAHLADIDMPPATNIVRPYRDRKLILGQVKRLNNFYG